MTARLFEPTDGDKAKVLTRYRFRRQCMGETPIAAIRSVTLTLADVVADLVLEGLTVEWEAPMYRACRDYDDAIWVKWYARAYWRTGRLGGAS